MNTRRLLVISVVVLLAFGAAAMVVSLLSDDAAAIRIGGLFALSGSAADWGRDEQEAFRLAIRDANQEGPIQGDSVVGIVENAPHENVRSSVGAFRRLVNVEGVAAVIGPTWDDVASAVAPVADETETIVISPDASSGVEAERDYEYFFSIFTPEHSEMSVLADHLYAERLRNVAIVYNMDPFSTTWANAFREAAESVGLKVVEDLPISDPDSRNFRTQIARLRDSDAQAVYIEFAEQSTKGVFLQQAVEQDLQTVFVSSSTTSTQSLLQKYGDVLEGLRFADPVRSKAAQEFRIRFEEELGHLPRSPAAPYSYDATRLMIRMIREAGTTDSDSLREMLLSVDNYSGVTASSISIDSTGRVEWPSEMYQLSEIRGDSVRPILSEGE